jgi:hypothetical protein
MKTVVIYNLGRQGKPSIWCNPYSFYWYATKRIPYTEWKGDTQDFQAYLWDVRSLRSFDKAVDAEFKIKSITDFDTVKRQTAYHYSVFVADEIKPSNGVRQFSLAAS